MTFDGMTWTNAASASATPSIDDMLKALPPVSKPPGSPFSPEAIGGLQVVVVRPDDMIQHRDMLFVGTAAYEALKAAVPCRQQVNP